jgi:hypothetical protein
MTDTIFYTLLAILAAAAAITIISVKRRRAVDKLRRTIEERWGRPPAARDYNSGSMQAISSYFNNYSEKQAGRFLIDDITWNDLDMDNVFKRINSTYSTAGEEYLYRLLREPAFDEAELKERERLIEHFRNNPVQRQKLQLYLARLGKKRFAGISDYFFNDKKVVSMRSLRYILHLAALLASPLVMIANAGVGILFFIVIFITNMTVYYKAKNEREVYMESLSYMVNLINYSKKIAHDSIGGIEGYTAVLKKASDKIRSFGIKSFYQLFYQTGDIFLEPIKVIFFVELIAFESLLKKIFKYRGEIRELYETLGKLDAMLSAASYRESVDYYAIPAFVTSKPAALSFTDAYHPLIKNPVANSLGISNSILITGSNASGKSTFLKTAAINGILAQTIHTCLAREYRSSMFMIYTSMALKDSLSNNESYYIAEIKSLKRLFDNMNNEFPILCMIDEVLRGTNTIERIAASSEVLQRLAGGNCLCVAATHDIELVSILKNRYGNYHFQESFRDNDIFFDYKIYPGKSTTRNAIKLLRLMGYSENVVASAEERAERFASEGKWHEIL